MALHASEEESLEALKKWWDENGKRLLLIVILVFGGYTSWLLVQNSRMDQIEAASDLYEEILALAIVDPGAQISDADRAEILSLADQLQDEHAGSIYSLFGALFAAQQQVAADDLDAAEQSLQWVLDNQEDGLFSQSDEGLTLTTTLRLGRVILAKGDAERALTLVNSIDPQAFEAGYAELRGDIYVAMGRLMDAREAYVAAQQAGSTSDGLRMKLEDLPEES